MPAPTRPKQQAPKLAKKRPGVQREMGTEAPGISPESAFSRAACSRGSLTAGDVLALQGTGGNQAVMRLLQARRAGGEAEDTAQVHQAAKVGIGGPGGGLPHLQTIQKSFGHHDVTGVVAHTGAQATAGAEAMGAAAFTIGNHVAFAGSADLHTAAHEAAHVIQQRGGVQLAGGVGAEGDKYERHADAVADGVVQGRSVEGFLDDSRGLERGPPRAQRSIDPNAIGPVQRVLTLDNADFSQVSSITKLGGNAEGAYLVDDGGGGAVVVKIAEGIDSTVMAYNLAKDFGVTTPKGRYLLLNTPSGEMLCVKAKQHSPELFAKLSKATSVTLWSLVKGKTLGTLGPAVGAEKGAIIGDANFEQIGRMLVFDAAILNEDRFKLATGQSANSGNLMVQDHAPVAIDQDFANVDKDPTSSRNDQIDDYGTYFSGKLQPLFSKPESMAGALCQKMVQEGFLMFEGQEQHILAGLISGIAILRNLLEGSNDRLPTLIAWAKTFDAKSDIDETKVRKYWESLLPK